MNTETLLIVFVACTGAAVLLQAIVLLAMFVTIRKTAKTVQEEMHEMRTTVTPVLNQTRDFLTNVGPKIDSVATDLAELAHGLRAQGEELQTSASEILERVHRQTSRMDTMFSGILDTLDRAGSVMTTAVNTPLRQISAVSAFARAAIASLRSGPPQNGPRPTHSPADKDLFV